MQQNVMPGSMQARRAAEPDVLFAAALVILGMAAMTQGGWIFAKAQLAQILLERAFTDSVATGLPVKPWSWADTWPVARIEVPRLGARVIALAGTSGQALAFGPGHVEGAPQAGDSGTAVYSAHRDTHFSFLGRIRPGDAIDVARSDGRRHRFRVTSTEVVRWDRSGIDAAAPGRHLVLATCWPLGARTPGPERYIVRAEAADAASLDGAAGPPARWSPSKGTSPDQSPLDAALRTQPLGVSCSCGWKRIL